MAQIILSREGEIVHRESRTFDRRPAAAAWLKRREAELAKPGAVLGRATRAGQATLGDAIRRLIAESARPLGRTRKATLEALLQEDAASLACADVDSPRLVRLAAELAQDRSPATVNNWFSHLAGVFAIARPAWGYPLDERAMADARTVARRLGYLGKSGRRTRRPTRGELDRILDHFAARRRGAAPMIAVTVFALYSTRRQEEILRLRWEDLDAPTDGPARVLVRDMKDPAAKAGNDVWCDLPPEALAIVRAMPRRDERIFPYSTDAVGAAFTRACALLGIADLHFHDMRHEGVSRLFEMGTSIPDAARVSGHRSWATLQRYAHLRHRGDVWAGWDGVARAVAEASGHQPVSP